MFTDLALPRLSLNNKKIRALATMLGLYDKTTPRLVEVASFGLPAGYTCPAASLCHSRVNVHTGKIIDYGEFRCYAAKLECGFPTLRRLHAANLKALARLKTVEQITAALLAMLDNYPSLKVLRVHDSGDFFSQNYYAAWVAVAQARPDIIFFGYTKVLAYAVDEAVPDNWHFVYSYGGLQDTAAIKVNAIGSTVVQDEQQAAELGLPVACPTPDSPNDYNFILRREPFALVFH